MQPRGFSLVELSIVLVILGLLTGGILAGQSLIRAAELRSVSTEYGKYMTAVRSFRDKYFAIPGDMTNATAFWGVLAGTGSDATCQGTTATGAATCNGDGDGSLMWNNTANNEIGRFWQHLANAGLIEGQYTGVLASGTCTVGIVPMGKMSGSCWLAYPGKGWAAGAGNTYYAGDTGSFAGDYGKSELVYKSLTASTSTAGSYPLKPEEAWNIDTKMDDGNPATGSVMGIKGDGTNTNCTSFAGVAPPGDAGATYKLSNSSKDCALYFVRAF